MRILFLSILVAGLSYTGAPAQTVIGWRTDGTGRYPDANPPLEWSKDKNVVWKTKMPGRSYSSPIVIGDRIFVVSDPAELLCLDSSNGKIVWQRSITVADVLGAEKADRIANTWTTINNNHRTLEREYRDFRRKNPDAKEQIQKLRKALDVSNDSIRAFRKANPVPGRNGSGNSAGTPVSDGKTIFVSFGNGIVAAYDLDGKRKWAQFIEGSELNFGHSSSLALVDGTLITHFHNLIALDAGAGKERWRIEADARHASPVVGRVAGKPIIVTPAGQIVGVRDGKVFASHRDLRVSECSPIIENGIVYVQAGKTSAFRLPDKVVATEELKPLWQIRTASGRRTPSPVLHKGLLYGITTNGMLDVVDVKSGESVYRKRFDLGNIYSSVSIAGDYLFITSTRGVTIVAKTGREYKQVAENELESMGSCPVFVGRRMFVRTRQHMYCIGK